MIKALRLIVLTILLFSCVQNKMIKDELVYTLRFPPTSLDPMNFDKLENQIVTSSINATLVSTLSTNGVVGLLASEWSNSDQFKKWNIKIKDQLAYSDGTPLSPEHVYLNFQRYIYLSKKNNSASGLLEKLEGYHKLNIDKIDDVAQISIEGMTLNKGILQFRFIDSVPSFLEKISFGIYAISHPRSFKKNGDWNDEKNVPTTGSYKVKDWKETEISLERVKNNEENFKTIKFIFGFNKENINQSDMVYASKNSLAFSKDWSFISKVKDSNIVYMKVMKWKDKGSFWSVKKNRQFVRDLYYKFLTDEGLDLSESFFPYHVAGVEKLLRANETTKENIAEIAMPPFFNSLKHESNYDKKDLGEIYKDAMVNLAKKINAQIKYVDYPSNERDEEKLFDLQFLGTGINIDDPYDDIKFMFLSKEGIKLPLENEEIKKMLMGNKFNVQKINEALHEEAIIWPIVFTSQGMWINKNSGISYIHANTTKVAIDFQFIRKND